MRIATQNIPRILVCAWCTLVLMTSGVCIAFTAAPSSALTVSEAQAALEEAEAEMERIVGEYDALNEEVTALQTQIDDTVAKAIEAQRRVTEGKDRLSHIALYQYRGGAAFSLLTLVLEADNFEDMIRNMDYLDELMEFQDAIIREQKELVAQYNALIDQLNAQKDEQVEKLAQLEEKREEAAALVEQCASDLASAKLEEAARLQALAAASVSMTSPTTIEEVTGQEGESGWYVGIASAYGGSTDANIPDNWTTATGAAIDDTTMGVAVPMAWENYRSYFGRTVEISYNGMTVLGIVNDCGYMGGGSRSLDLQPGIFRAFGFSSCNAWGLRTVQYRFL